jgi:hypothetical protein
VLALALLPACQSSSSSGSDDDSDAGTDSDSDVDTDTDSDTDTDTDTDGDTECEEDASVFCDDGSVWSHDPCEDETTLVDECEDYSETWLSINAFCFEIETEDVPPVCMECNTSWSCLSAGSWSDDVSGCDFCQGEADLPVDGCGDECGGIYWPECPNSELICARGEPNLFWDGPGHCMAAAALSCETHEDCLGLPSADGGCSYEDGCTTWLCWDSMCVPVCWSDMLPEHWWFD